MDQEKKRYVLDLSSYEEYKAKGSLTPESKLLKNYNNIDNFNEESSKNISIENSKIPKLNAEFSYKLKLNPNAKPIHFNKNKMIQYDESNYF